MDANRNKHLSKLFVGLLFVFGGLLYVYYIIIRPPVEIYSTSDFRFLFGIYATGNKPNQLLKRPSDVAFDTAGNLYIADTGNGRVLMFNGRGRFLRKIGRTGTGMGRFRVPIGIAVSDDGFVYVADQAGNKVVCFDADGKVEWEIKVKSPTKPLVVGSKLYIANRNGVTVHERITGSRLFRFGKAGRAEGEFNYAVGLAVGKSGMIYVSDLNNLRIQAFDKTGNFRWVVGKPPTQLSGSKRRFGLPAGVALDERGLLYVVDAFKHRVEVLDPNGRTVARLSQRGEKEGQLYFPQGIAYWQEGIFAIADKYNDRIQVVEITVGGR